MDALAILDVGAGCYDHNVAKAHLEVLADNLVHADLRLLASVVSEDNAHRVLALFALLTPLSIPDICSTHDCSVTKASLCGQATKMRKQLKCDGENRP